MRQSESAYYPKVTSRNDDDPAGWGHADILPLFSNLDKIIVRIILFSIVLAFSHYFKKIILGS